MDILTYALAKSGSGSDNQPQAEKHLYQHHMIFNSGKRNGNISVLVVDNNATPYSKYSDLYEIYAGKKFAASGISFDSAISYAYLIKSIELISSTKVSYGYAWQLHPSPTEKMGGITCNVGASFIIEDTVIEI